MRKYRKHGPYFVVRIAGKTVDCIEAEHLGEALAEAELKWTTPIVRGRRDAHKLMIEVQAVPGYEKPMKYFHTTVTTIA